MKIRNGFVSNSSSSSFIVMFPKEPENVYDVMKMLFSKNESSIKTFNEFINESYDEYYPHSWSESQIADQVWNDIKKQNPNDLLKGVYELSSDQYGHWYDDDKKMLIYSPSWKDEDFFKGYITIEELEKDIYYNKTLEPSEENDWEDNKDYQLEIYEESLEELKSFMNNKIGVMYSFCYSDEDGDFFSFMEHGDIFSNLSHKIISKH